MMTTHACLTGETNVALAQSSLMTNHASLTGKKNK